MFNDCNTGTRLLERDTELKEDTESKGRHFTSLLYLKEYQDNTLNLVSHEQFTNLVTNRQLYVTKTLLELYLDKKKFMIGCHSLIYVINPISVSLYNTSPTFLTGSPYLY